VTPGARGATARPGKQGVRLGTGFKQEQAEWLDLHPWQTNFDGVSGEILINNYWRLEKAIAPHRYRHGPIIKLAA